MRINGGTVAVVTGAAGGLGRALTAGLLARGAKVAAWDVAEGVHSWPGVPAAARSRIEPMRVDVTDSEGVLSAAAALLSRHPGVDILVNSAAVTVAAPLHLTSLAALEQPMDVNYRGAVRCTLALLPALRTRSAASVVNVLSPFALCGFPTKSAYAASKAALRVFTETLRIEAEGTGLCVTSVYCGAMATDFVRDAPSWDATSRETEHSLLQRYGAPPARVADRILKAIETRRTRVRIGAAR